MTIIFCPVVSIPLILNIQSYNVVRFYIPTLKEKGLKVHWLLGWKQNITPKQQKLTIQTKLMKGKDCIFYFLHENRNEKTPLFLFVKRYPVSKAE